MNAREDALNRRFDATKNKSLMLFYRLRQDNARGHRLLAELIEARRHDGRELVDVGRKWAKNPLDLMAVARHAIDVSANSQDRTATAVRRWLDDLLESRPEWKPRAKAETTAQQSAMPAPVPRTRSRRRARDVQATPPAEAEPAQTST